MFGPGGQCSTSFSLAQPHFEALPTSILSGLLDTLASSRVPSDVTRHPTMVRRMYASRRGLCALLNSYPKACHNL